MKTEAHVVTEQPNPGEYITVAEVRKTLRISKPLVAQMVHLELFEDEEGLSVSSAACVKARPRPKKP